MKWHTYGRTNTLNRKNRRKIWDTVVQGIGIEDLREEMKKFKSNKSPGPSGVTIEMIKKMDDENLERIADSMNKMILGGRQVPATWNTTVLRPLPKSEAGLYDISKTRPIALMEVILKLLERVIFSRINKDIDDNTVLLSEQYGGINSRLMQDPIRILVELIEDVNVTKKELHIFSADLSKGFDTLEYWSQAMSWRALGAPNEMVNMLVDMRENSGNIGARQNNRDNNKREGDIRKCQRSETRVSRRADEVDGVHELLVRICTQHNRREWIQDEYRHS